jgi:hypothetical protein
MTEEQDFSERADHLDDTPGIDQALSASIVGLQAVPVVGGIVAALISEYVPRRKQRRLVEFVEDLGRAFEAEQDRIDAEFVRSTEFDRMWEDALDRVQSVRNEGKLGYWAALLAGVATHDRPPERDRERMIDTLDSIREPHLRLLHVIATTNEPPPGLMAGGVSSTLSWKMPDVPDDEARRDWADLARHGVVGDYPSGTMTAQGAGNLSGRLTPYGREFVRMLRLEAGHAD